MKKKRILKVHSVLEKFPCFKGLLDGIKNLFDFKSKFFGLKTSLDYDDTQSRIAYEN